MRPSPRPPRQRFMARIRVVTGEHWHWRAAGARGDADWPPLVAWFRIGTDAKRPPRDARRAGWELFRGTVPDGYLLRSCRTDPACMNPWHMSQAPAATVFRSHRSPVRRGEACASAQLTEVEVRSIFAAYNAGAVVSDLAKHLRRKRSTLQAALDGGTWQHLGLRKSRAPHHIGGASPGETHPKAKLSSLDVQLARHLRACGYSRREISARLGRPDVAEATILAAAVGRTWRHLPMPTGGAA